MLWNYNKFYSNVDWTVCKKNEIFFVVGMLKVKMFCLEFITVVWNFLRWMDRSVLWQANWRVQKKSWTEVSFLNRSVLLPTEVTFFFTENRSVLFLIFTDQKCPFPNLLMYQKKSQYLVSLLVFCDFGGSSCKLEIILKRCLVPVFSYTLKEINDLNPTIRKKV